MALTTEQLIEIANLSNKDTHVQEAASMAANALQDLMLCDDLCYTSGALLDAQAALAAERKINAELRVEREKYRADTRCIGLENALVALQSHREHLESQLSASQQDSRMFDYLAKMPADIQKWDDGTWHCVVDLNNNKKYTGSAKYIHITGDSVRAAISAAMEQMSYFE